MIDGLGLFATRFVYGQIPNEANFVQDVSTFCATVEEFITRQERHVRTFSEFAADVAYDVTGCLPHADFVNDIARETYAARPERFTDGNSLGARLSESQASEACKLILTLREKAQEDISKLLGLIPKLADPTNAWNEKIVQREQEVVKRYNLMVEQIRPEVESKVARYTEAMNEQISKLERSRLERASAYEPQLHQLRIEEGVAEREVEAARSSGSYSPEKKATLSSIRRRRIDVENSVDRINKEHNRANHDSRTYYGNLINAERERIRALERARDNEVGRYEATRRMLNDNTGAIIDRIKRLAARKTEFISSIDRLSLTRPQNLMGHTKLFVPLYVARMEGTGSGRYQVYPPIVVKARKGIVGTIMGILGKAVLPFEPRTERFEKVLKQRFMDSIQAFEAELFQIGRDFNLLARDDIKRSLYEGLEYLRREGLVSDSYAASMRVRFDKHFALALPPITPGRRLRAIRCRKALERLDELYRLGRISIRAYRELRSEYEKELMALEGST